MRIPGSISRRELIAAAGAALLRPSMIRVAPSDRIGLGFIGLGERGMHLLGQFLAEPDVQIVAVCDVERLHYRERTWGEGRPLGREPACALVERSCGGRPRLVTADFRDVCGDDGVDAVVAEHGHLRHAVALHDPLRVCRWSDVLDFRRPPDRHAVDRP